MKKLYLASQFYVTGMSIGAKIAPALKKNTVFITTPIKYKVFKESELDWHYKNRATLSEAGFTFDDYDITGKTPPEFKKDLSKYAVIYVEGGNPFYMLQESQRTHFDQYLFERVSNGMVYISESAGSVVAGIDIAANSRVGKSVSDYDLSTSSGFSFINFGFMPHWSMASKKKDYQQSKVPQSYKEDFPHLLLTNNHYVEVTGDWYKIIDISKE